jgi:hypothetical protein
MHVNEAQEVKQLREETGRPKKLVADLSLDTDALHSVIRKKGGDPVLKAAVGQAREEYAFSGRRGAADRVAAHSAGRADQTPKWRVFTEG